MRVVIISLCALLFMPVYVSAVTWNVVDGQLMGAGDVNVGGSFYNVEFLDGTCVDLFGGCNEQSNFSFSFEGAEMAQRALLDQVLVDTIHGNFDTSPELINGIDQNWAYTFTPYGFYSGGGISVVFAINYGFTLNGYDSIADGNIAAGFDTKVHQGYTWARWTAVEPVPEPSTLLLLGTGLAGLAFTRRKGKRQ